MRSVGMPRVPGRALAGVLAAGLLATVISGCAMPRAAAGGGGATGPMAFAACMRAHGVPDYPDPKGGGAKTQESPGGGVTINGVRLKETNAQFDAAQQACQATLDDVAANAPPNPRLEQAALAYGACMRAHGIPNFADPVVTGNTVNSVQHVGSGADPNSPAFQAAQQACQPAMASALQAAHPNNG